MTRFHGVMTGLPASAGSSYRLKPVARSDRAGHGLSIGLAAVAVLVGTAAARADVLRTLDGRAAAGVVAVDGRGVRVDGGAAVPLADVLDVTFNRRTRPPGQSCVLVDGTTLAGHLDGVDARGVRVTTAAAGVLAVPTGRVARVWFGPASGELLGRVPAGGAGLLLRTATFSTGRCNGSTGRR